MIAMVAFGRHVRDNTANQQHSRGERTARIRHPAVFLTKLLSLPGMIRDMRLLEVNVRRTDNTKVISDEK